MSLWTHYRDASEKILTFGLYDPKKSREQDRQQRQVVNDQIAAYKEQTALAKQELDETRAQTETERRRVQEKQIRSLRRNYRAASIGMLGQGQPATQDMDTKLGGQ